MEKAASKDKSSDYLFASNKIEKRDLAAISPALADLKKELLSDSFQGLLEQITQIKGIFSDP